MRHYLCIALVFLGLSARAATPTLDNFNREHFNITQGGAPTNVIKVLNVSPWTNSAGTVQLVDLTLPVRIDSRIIWGPGTGHYLSREGDYLIWTNNSSSVEMRVKSAANYAYMAATASGATFGNAGPNVVLANSVVNLQLNYTNLVGNTPGINVGQIGNPFANGVFQGTIYDIGFWDITGTNYSRVAFSHQGTNGYFTVDSQSSGTAGPPRPIMVQMGGTNYYEFGNDGKLHIYEFKNGANYQGIAIDFGGGGGYGATIATEAGGTGSHEQLMLASQSGKLTLQSAYSALSDGSAILGLTSGAASYIHDNVGTNLPAPITTTFAFTALNSQNATATVQQNSPSIAWTGGGWSSGASSSRLVDFIAWLTPTAGSEPTAAWILGSRVNLGTVVTNFSVSSSSGWTGAGTRYFTDAGTFVEAFGTTTITNITVNQTATFKGKAVFQKGTEQYQGVLTHAGTVTLDFDPDQLTTRSITLTGSLTLAYSNLATNRNYRLKIEQPQATNCTLTLPSGTHGYYTTTLSNGWHMASFEAWGSVASNVWVSTSSEGTY